MRIKIAHKLWLSFGLVLAMMLATVLVMQFKTNNSIATCEQFTNDFLPLSLAAADMKLQAAQIQQWLTDVSATHNRDGYGDADEAVDVAACRDAVDHPRRPRGAHGMTDLVDLPGARQGDGIDECVLDWRFLAAAVVVARSAGLAAPVRPVDLARRIPARQQLVVGVVEVRGFAGIAVHQHHVVDTGRRHRRREHATQDRGAERHLAYVHATLPGTERTATPVAA